MHQQHVIGPTIGPSTTWEFKKVGGFRRIVKTRDAICLFPSDQPFYCRPKVERGVIVNVLFLALDPVFVSRIAEGLELDSDRIELVEQRRIIDPTLRHIALALRAGVQSGAALDRMYGEALSTALAVHLLREYGAEVPGPNRQYGRLPREKLVRAIQYIQDHLNPHLTVSGIPHTFALSP